MKYRFEDLNKYLEKYIALNEALVLMEWDQETLAPSFSSDNTAKTMGILADIRYNALINKEVEDILEYYKKDKNLQELCPNLQCQVKEVIKEYDKLKDIPGEDYRKYNELVTKSMTVWAKAKEKDDFSIFAPYLKEVIDYQKKFAKLRSKGKMKPYDVLLKDYEEDYDTEKLDKFFEPIKVATIELLDEAIRNSDCDKSYNHQSFDIDKQKQFCEFLSDYLGMDKERTVISQSAHPFTTNLHKNDVRITNHYYENNLESAIFSAIHETGHALYELGIDDDITQTVIGEGSSMGVHESQSRFYENIIGKNKAFWEPIYPKLKQLFDKELEGVDLNMWIKGFNKVSPSLIRTESDELTYVLHIIIRYEIEKMIFEEDVDVMDLPKLWNDKYEEYLGIRPKKDSEGILQDVHWSDGSFGYFPSYAIGNAVAAQLYYQIKKDIPFEEYLREGKLYKIRDYLDNKIHKYGKAKTLEEILLSVTGEGLDSKYYIQYINEKWKQAQH